MPRWPQGRTRNFAGQSTLICCLPHPFKSWDILGPLGSARESHMRRSATGTIRKLARQRLKSSTLEEEKSGRRHIRLTAKAKDQVATSLGAFLPTLLCMTVLSTSFHLARLAADIKGNPPYQAIMVASNPGNLFICEHAMGRFRSLVMIRGVSSGKVPARV
jgi:hypothetical protein